MAKKGLGRGLGAIFGDDTVAAASEKRKTRRAASSDSSKGASASSSENESGKESDNKSGKTSGRTAGRTSVRTAGSAGKAQGAVSAAEAAAVTAADADNVSRETSKIKISLIEPDTDQPRKNFNEESLQELASSIKEFGVLQPIIVKKSGEMYKIVVGERRWRAARIAGIKEIPAIVKDLDKKETAEIALIENIQREDLSSVEEAKAFRSLIEEYGLTQEELASRVSKNRTTITNSLRLLQLDDEILEFIESGELSAGHARALLSISGKKAQYKAAREVINDGLSVREAEKLAKSYNRKGKKTAAVKTPDIYSEALAGELTEIMKLKVNIKKRGKSKGKVEIEFNSDEELEIIIDALRNGGM